MDGAFVENTERHVDGEKRHGDQHGLSGERFRKRSGIALKSPLDVGWRAEFAHYALDDLRTPLDR